MSALVIDYLCLSDDPGRHPSPSRPEPARASRAVVHSLEAMMDARVQIHGPSWRVPGLWM